MSIVDPLGLAPFSMEIRQGAHHGSGMYMTGKGNRRQVSYDTPRDGLATLGIAKGTLLFDGELNGSSLSGSVVAYAPNCHALTYPVSGVLSPDGSHITLMGRRPSRDQWCNFVEWKDVTLIFDFVR
jgi:hypothetical protein